MSKRKNSDVFGLLLGLAAIGLGLYAGSRRSSASFDIEEITYDVEHEEIE